MGYDLHEATGITDVAASIIVAAIISGSLFANYYKYYETRPGYQCLSKEHLQLDAQTIASSG